MHTIIHPTSSSRSVRNSSASEFRQPNYDCREHSENVKLTVYTPGVNPASIEIEIAGPDLVVTARKPHVVRVNWAALNLEGAQRDYRLRLRLGRGLDYSALHAEFHDGVLSLTLPKRQPVAPAARMLNVA
jgi:HSP20 family protein